MKPEIKRFSKEKPCTKQDVWNCFSYEGHDLFKGVQVDLAHSLIGIYTPREMIRAGRLRKSVWKHEDIYELTEEGIDWLLNWKNTNKV